MNTITLVFKVHHPFYLRSYRFFDIGQRHNYYDDYRDKYLLKRFSERCYYQANALMNRLLDRHGDKFRFAFVFTGNSMDQMQWYMPELLDDFRHLISRPGVELLSTDYSGSAIAVMDKELWKAQVDLHRQRALEVFGKCSDVLAGTQLLYDDAIGEAASRMGFSGLLTEGAKPVLGWKSPHVVYSHPETGLKLILRDAVLSEDISLRFSDRSDSQWPFTAEKTLEKMQADAAVLEGNSHVTLYVNYAVMGEFQERESGIFDYFEALVDQVLSKTGFRFEFPSRLCSLKEDYPALHVPYTVSDLDEEKDLTAFYANELQKDVMENWQRACQAMRHCTDSELHKDFRFLTGVENLDFMATKYFTGRPSIRYLNPYDSPYDAYINYMNVWSDFLSRLKSAGLMDENGRAAGDPAARIAEKARQAMGLAADLARTAAATATEAVSDFVAKACKADMKKKAEEARKVATEMVSDFVAKARKTDMKKKAEEARKVTTETISEAKDQVSRVVEEAKGKLSRVMASTRKRVEKAARTARTAVDSMMEAVSEREAAAKTATAKSAAARKAPAAAAIEETVSGKASTRKTTAKKAATKRVSAAVPAGKTAKGKALPEKASAKKTAAKTATAKPATAKKPAAAKTAVAKTATAKPAAARKASAAAAVKETVSGKASTRKAPAKKAATKRASAKGAE